MVWSAMRGPRAAPRRLRRRHPYRQSPHWERYATARAPEEGECALELLRRATRDRRVPPGAMASPRPPAASRMKLRRHGEIGQGPRLALQLVASAASTKFGLSMELIRRSAPPPRCRAPITRRMSGRSNDRVGGTVTAPAPTCVERWTRHSANRGWRELAHELASHLRSG